MNGTMMLASLLVTDTSPACTVSDDPPNSVPFCYRDFDLGESIDAETDSFASEDEIVTWSGLESISCLDEAIHRVWAGSHSG